MGICSNLWNRACEQLILKEDTVPTNTISMEEMLKQAHEELEQAENLFARVEDPEMIDYAILKLQAAEKRYNYLLKQFRNKTKYK